MLYFSKANFRLYADVNSSMLAFSLINLLLVIVLVLSFLVYYVLFLNKYFSMEYI